MRRVTITALATAGAVLAGCGTIDKSGGVGDTLGARGVDVTVLKVDRSVPRPERDITGLGTPRPGTRFTGVKVKACTGDDQAVKAYDFQLKPDEGDSVHPRTPVSVYSDSFDVLRSGCETGWLVFPLPSGARAAAVKFSYDDTGTPGQGGRNGKRLRFTWKL